jgi:hypothetical protein
VYTPERNPFEVLGLDPAASEEEVVRRAGQLRRRAAGEAEVAELRRAVQALTGRAEDRQLLALLTHPRPGYAAPSLERLAAEFRRPPAAAGPPPACPPPDLAEVAAWLAARLAEALEGEQLPFEPVAPDDESAEIRRQNDEALWQSFIFDGRA